MISEPGDRLVPAVSAVLLASAFPPLHLLLPAFVGLVPLAVWVVAHDGATATVRQGAHRAFRGAAWFGLIYFGLVFHWIAVALVPVTFWAIPAYLGVVSALAIMAGTFGWTLRRLVHRGRVPLWIALPLAWTALEWLRAHAPGGVALPWLGLGTSLTAYPELVGAAELVGARGITFWLALVNGLLAEAVLAARRGAGHHTIRMWVAGVVVVVAVPAFWGHWRAGELEVRSLGRVVVVQPNVSQPLRLDRTVTIDTTLSALERLAPTADRPDRSAATTLPDPSAATTPPDLVVWPEATVLAAIEADSGLGRRVADVARLWGVPVLFGAIGLGSEGGRPGVPFNSAFLTDPQGIVTPYRYDKHHLVPLVERVPFVPVGWVASEQVFGQYGRGDTWPLGATTSGARFGTLICFESAFASHARRFRLEGADFLVNITNDGWFGREAWYTRTGALWQHPAHLVMRAIENRVGVVRAANTGISLFVDPRGHVYEQTELFVADTRAAVVQTTDVVTLYTRTGDVVGPLALVLTLVLLVGIGRDRPPA